MPERVDLTSLQVYLDMGRAISPETIANMRNELLAWRASHEACGIVLQCFDNVVNTEELTAIQAYRSAVEATLAEMGYTPPPKGG